jgi:selenocysteine-specific elongation factor
MIIGTAGHIDHGKTSLVRALTGIDTDRLKEEKERGITIELGFAYIPTDAGAMLGFVDVPGHERLVHTMIAGAASIDMALLVVAADDGVMPQTREHLQILSLLGIGRGVVALTKTDLVAVDRIAEVTREIEAVLATTPLAGAQVIEVSSATGAGVEALKHTLCRLAVQEPHRSTNRAFRLAVDRSFTLAGAGTVVTGSIVAGEVRLGDTVLVSPSGLTARVRSLHAMNRAAEHGIEGDRCALNLRGPDVHHSNIRRGDWIAAPANASLSSRCDIELTLLNTERRGMRHWTPVQLHHGAAQSDARVVLLENDVLQPGQSGLAQLIVDQPQLFRYGDRIVLRDTSAQRTIAGGRILDPSAPDRNRRRPERLALLRSLTANSPADALRQALALPPFLCNRGKLLRDWGLTERGLENLAPDLAFLPSGDDAFLTTPDRLSELMEMLIATLNSRHDREPMLPGVSFEALRTSLPVRVQRPQFSALLAHAIATGEVVNQDGLLRARGHEARLPPDVARVQTGVRDVLSQSPFRPPRIADLAKAINAPEPTVRKICKQLARAGMIVEIAPDHFFLRSAVLDSARVAAQLSADTGGAFTAAQFRDRLGNGRQLAIQILDYLDRRGVTLRKGDTRRLGKQPDQALGNHASSW